MPMESWVRGKSSCGWPVGASCANAGVQARAVRAARQRRRIMGRMVRSDVKVVRVMVAQLKGSVRRRAIVAAGRQLPDGAALE